MSLKRLFLFLTLCFFLTTSAYAQDREQKAIAFAKNLSPSALDSALPQGRFADWLTKVVGDSAVIRWELNDCGEQTGDSAIDNHRDIPICIEIDVTLPDNRKIGVMISVGTHNTGLSGEPAVFDMFVESKGKFRTIRRLGDLKRELRSF